MNVSRTTYAFADFLGLFGERSRVGDGLVADVSEELIFVLAVERRLTAQHFEEQHAVRPPVHTSTVRLVLDYLQHLARQ